MDLNHVLMPPQAFGCSESTPGAFFATSFHTATSSATLRTLVQGLWVHVGFRSKGVFLLPVSAPRSCPDASENSRAGAFRAMSSPMPQPNMKVLQWASNLGLRT